MTGGPFTGFGWGLPTPFGSIGGGINVDQYGNVYPQLYWGSTPGSAFSGYATNLEEFLTGPSVSASDGGKRLVLGGNGGSLAVGAGTPGFSFTWGFGPFRIPPYVYKRLGIPLPGDPLVLDLSGNGLHLTSVTNSPAYFDFGGTGFATQTGQRARPRCRQTSPASWHRPWRRIGNMHERARSRTNLRI